MFLIGSIAMMILSCLLERDVQDSLDRKQQNIIGNRLVCAKLMAATTVVMGYLYYRYVLEARIHNAKIVKAN